MFKQICFFRKRADMTMEQFMDYYENRHSKLGKLKGLAPAMPNAQRYVRRYVTQELNPVTLEKLDPGYDCIMEIWWNSRADFENSVRIISDPARLPHTKADEAEFFASHDNPVCSVVEYDSPMGPQGEPTTVAVKHGADVPAGKASGFKQLCFFKKRPDRTLEEFMDYYENQHSQFSKKLGQKPSMPGASRYVRRYLTPELNPVTLERIDPGYDCLMEIWWNSREEFENARAIIQDPTRLKLLKEDEVNLFASHSNPVCSVIEYDSPMGPQGEPTTAEVKHG